MNDEEHPLVIAIREAAYSDLNHLTQHYMQTDGLENCLPLMQPDNLRQVIRSALENMSQLCVGVMESMYEEKENQLHDSRAIRALRPSVRLREEVMQMMASNLRRIELEISTYESRFNNFLGLIGQASESAESNAYGAGAIGGFVGAIIAGPLGAIIGGAACGAFSGHCSQENIQAEGHNLCSAFCNVLQSTENYLGGIAHQALEAVIHYNTQLESSASNTQLKN